VGKIVTVEYVDDLDGTDVDADVVDTVAFSYRGQDYTLVLSSANGAQFDKDMARYITAAKKVQVREARAARGRARPEPRKSVTVKAAPRRSRAVQRKTTGAVSRKTATAVSGRERNRLIREWAVTNGHQVSRRGRISAVVENAYNAAH
jgi:hypothetical protein